MDYSTPSLDTASLYGLSDGTDIVSRAGFSSPTDEYLAAFADTDSPFLYHYKVVNDRVETQIFTRGKFLELARCGATCLIFHGVKKGDRVAHCFSENSSSDLILRLAEIMVGAVPVTINWQADNEERIIYKITASRARTVFYDEGFEEKIAGMRPALQEKTLLPIDLLTTLAPVTLADLAHLDYKDEKAIIFTSGTTGLPKGVLLSHRSYLANRLTFEGYFHLDPSIPLDLLMVNPLHHTNSSSLADWGMRRKNAVIHLVEQYSTRFWLILAAAEQKKRGMFLTSLVPRHFDFLENLSEQSRLPLDQAELAAALERTDILLGSAPVGATTVKNALRFCKRVPHVRFGSTETCLQVMAIPVTLSDEETMAAFQSGWQHCHRGEKAPGFYIGRPHFPFTRVRIVKAVDPGQDGYLCPCEPGQPGYLITQGANLMTGYVNQEEATRAVFRNHWYTGLRDVGFFLIAADGQLDYYWLGRDSALLIRGGANYAYEQVAADLTKALSEELHLPVEQFKLAVVGLTIDSEHEDSCCVTIELNEQAALREHELAKDFIAAATRAVPKGSRPDYLRFGKIPCNFKGAILYPQLKKEFREYLDSMIKRTTAHPEPVEG